MNHKEINKRIAEYCGWDRRDSAPEFQEWVGWAKWRSPTGVWHIEAPNYCTDLNAMHEAVVALPREMQLKYVINLIKVVQNCGIDMRDLVNATAHQCAEAFLKTVGKWE